MVTDIETNRKLALEANDLAMCESRNLEAYVKGIIRRFDEDDITTKVEDLEEIATKTRKADEAASFASNDLKTLSSACSDLRHKAKIALGPNASS